jgi:MSHA biogenesis protein MshN
MAVLLIAAVAWVAWLVWQLQPREPIATALAFKAAQNATRMSSTAAAPVSAEPRPPVREPQIRKPVAESKPGGEAAAVAETKPVTEAKPSTPSPAPKAPVAAKSETKTPPARAVPPAAAVTAATATAPAEKTRTPPAKMLGLDVPPARILQAPQGSVARVEKRDRTRSAEDRAESEFRRGAVLLNEGRVAEAEDVFAAALGISPAHEAARQALVALHLEQGRIDAARRLLQEGVALNPANTRFATVLARVHMERRDFAAALEVLNAVKGPEQAAADFLSMRGTALQQLGRHAEAVEAFQGALRGAPQSGAVWMGLAISLESSGKKPDAADAFRRAAATGTLGAETRAYAEQRARQLR